MQYHYKAYKVIQTQAALCKRESAAPIPHACTCRICKKQFVGFGALCDEHKKKITAEQAAQRALANALLIAREQSKPKTPRTEIQED